VVAGGGGGVGVDRGCRRRDATRAGRRRQVGRRAVLVRSSWARFVWRRWAVRTGMPYPGRVSLIMGGPSQKLMKNSLAEGRSVSL
jgi:hypothetical protein